jgi:hypothetical protein
MRRTKINHTFFLSATSMQFSPLIQSITAISYVVLLIYLKTSMVFSWHRNCEQSSQQLPSIYLGIADVEIIKPRRTGKAGF